MRLLLDTHALLWWSGNHPALSVAADRLLSEGSHEVYVSAASAWEVTTKARLGNLPGPHRDPFDRMLIARAQAENLRLVSNETVFDRYGVVRVW